MKKSIGIAVLGASALALAACGGSGDASSDLEVETVEQPAEAALEPVTEEPVEDAGAAASEEVAGPAPVSEQTATEAAEAAADVAAAVEAAEAAEAAAAAEAAELAAAAEAAAELDVE